MARPSTRYFVRLILRSGKTVEVNTEFSLAGAKTFANNLINQHPDKYTGFQLFETTCS